MTGLSSDWAKVAECLDDKKCAFIIFFKDNHSPLLCSFVPEQSGMKDRMIYPTSKGALLGLVGVDTEKFNCNAQNDFTLDESSAHAAIKAPLSEVEAALASSDGYRAPPKSDIKKDKQFSMIA